MTAGRHAPRLALIALAVLVGWSTASYPSGSDGAYWYDKHWHRQLLAALQSSLHYPNDATGQPARPVPETVQATVSFTYNDAKIQDPKIVKSSGRLELDTAFLSGISTAQPPKASGSHAAEAHQFVVALEMRTPMQDFEAAILKEINAKWIWPRDLLLAGMLGPITVEFNYYDGKVSDIKAVGSTGSTIMDKAVMRTVAAANMPSPPTWLPRESLAMKAILDYQLGESEPCWHCQVRLQAPDTSQVLSPPSGP